MISLFRVWWNIGNVKFAAMFGMSSLLQCLQCFCNAFFKGTPDPRLQGVRDHARSGHLQGPLSHRPGLLRRAQLLSSRNSRHSCENSNFIPFHDGTQVSFDFIIHVITQIALNPYINLVKNHGATVRGATKI